jgi:ABC-2 type transport system permease protein
MFFSRLRDLRRLCLRWSADALDAAFLMFRSLAAPTWLILRNDLRLLWRDLRTGKMKLLSNVGFIALMLAALHLLTITVALGRKDPPPLFGETMGWLFFGFMMLGTAMAHAIAVLFERADFDLLLSSPVPSRAILLARWCGMTVASAAGVALLLVPVLNGAAIGLSPRYLHGYAVWILLASITACMGIFLTVVLVRWLGARRARIWTQVLGAVFGALVYLGFQLQNILRKEIGEAVGAAAQRGFEHPALTFVARAARGEILSLVILLTLAVVVLVATLRLLTRLFIGGIQEAGGVTPGKKRRIGRHVFANGLSWATFWKDLRLIARDPLLLSKVLPSVLYLLPLILVVGKAGSTATIAMLAAFGVMSVMIFSTQLASIATAGEEGWDLIRMSGASTVRLRIAKIAASMALPAGICVLVAIAIAVLGRPGVALLTIAIAVIAATATCWLEVATIRPTPRKDLIQNVRRGREFSAGRIMTSVVCVTVGIGSVTLAANNKWLLAAFAAGVLVLTAVACLTLVQARDPEFDHTG